MPRNRKSNGVVPVGLYFSRNRYGWTFWMLEDKKYVPLGKYYPDALAEFLRHKEGRDGKLPNRVIDWCNAWDNFCSYVDSQDARKCWKWLGFKDQDGYGIYRVLGISDRAHRIAYMLTTGNDIEKGQVVRHSCDNPACCNPRHLAIGRPRDNVSDRVTRNRSARGSDYKRSRLTEADVTTIRLSKESSLLLASRYGVSDRTIRAIRSRMTWKHVR